VEGSVVSLSTHTGTGDDVGSNASSGVLPGDLAHTMGAMPAQAYGNSATGIGTARGWRPDTTRPSPGSPTSTGGRNGVLSGEDATTSAASTPVSSSSVAMPLRAAGNVAARPVGVQPARAPAPTRPTPPAAPADRARPDAGTGGRQSVEIVFLVFDGAVRPEPTPTDVPEPERIPELADWAPGMGNASVLPPDPVTEPIPPAEAPKVEPPKTEPPKVEPPKTEQTEGPAETPRAVPQIEGSALSGLDSALMLTWLLGEPVDPPIR
jgi:hypothetical protein